MRRLVGAIFLGLVIFGAGNAVAAEPGLAVDGTKLSLLWALPFVGILLSIALCPLLAPSFWHHHYGKTALFWAACFVVPYFFLAGFTPTLYAVLHTLLLEYIPFIILLFALYTVAGGLYVDGNVHGSPAVNTALLAFGTLLASLVGTTGASMILIRPLVRANDARRHNTHVVIFFIFLVSNIGGSLTPLGDPPLFLGFLKGVDFFWTTTHLLSEMLFAATILLAVFFVLDTYFARKEAGSLPVRDPTPDRPVKLQGSVNLLLLGAIILTLILCSQWKSGVSFALFHIELALQDVTRDVGLLVIAFLSLRLTSAPAREGNGFNWGPIAEVGKLFVGIFLAITPVLAILQAGKAGALSGLIALVTRPDGTPNNVMYFWLSGGLSSFLDNAPTYLLFFNVAGGEAQRLMGEGALTLAAISCGSVFMGANSYIGNAPNFMVKSIAEDMNVKMPSFFAYCAWALCFLVPVFILVTLVFFPASSLGVAS